MAEIEIEGKTVEEAINEGLLKLGCAREKVEIKILNEGTSGLFGLMGTKPARVLLVTKDDEVSLADSSIEAKTSKTVKDILDLMKISYDDIITSSDSEQVSIDIKSKEGSIIIGKNGQTLESLEHIVNLIINKKREPRLKINIDTEHYRLRQEERIQSSAKKAVEQVKRTGKIFRFEPMPAKDRRVIHVLLKDNPDVETFSEGEGIYRKVGVKLKNKK